MLSTLLGLPHSEKRAIDSIAFDLEDYDSTEERRIVSSTVNIFAGILSYV